MTSKGNGKKKREAQALRRGQASGKGKAHSGSLTPSGSGGKEELSSVRWTKKKSPHFGKLELPKKPDVSKMPEWTTKEYAEYDKYLIIKWHIYGFCAEDLGYVSTRKSNSGVVWVYETLYK